MPSRIVLLGPPAALRRLQEGLDPTAEIKTFGEAETPAALEHISRFIPGLVAIAAEFADSSAGQALIARIKDDAALRAVEVRVIAKGSVEDSRRRAPRLIIKRGVEISVDGNRVALIDLSTLGAQVVSATVLKPNQRVRVVMGDGQAAVKCAGAIAWASLEMPQGMPTRYRAGIDWGVTPNSSLVERFAREHTQA